MFKKIFNYYFPSHGMSGRGINTIPVIVTYVIIGLFAFGHNYVNHPIMDDYKKQVWISTVDEKGNEIAAKTGWSAEEFPVNEPDVMLSGLKATAVGLCWPAYVMVLVNEKLK